VGNRARGDRLSSILGSPSKQRLAASLLLLSPYVPLLFMGEEYGEEARFPYFCSFDDMTLVEAVRAGRKQELEALAWHGEVPDPAAEATFNGAKLCWSWPEGSSRQGLRRLYRDLIAARRQWPALRDFQRRSARLLTDHNSGPILELIRGDQAVGGSIRALFNLSDRPRRVPDGAASETRMSFSSEAPVYGGDRDAAGASGLLTLHPFECIVLGPCLEPAHPSSETLP
jgi:maltooligosyltrehalose trehalohydrolase